MKLSVLLFLSILTISHLSTAREVEVDLDGEKYICIPSEVKPQDPGGAVECVSKAYQGPFSRQEADQLCQGARSDAPARCGIKVYAGPFSKTEALSICSGARTEGPGDCALTLYAGPFSKAETLGFCTNQTTKGHADCAIKAYQGPYSKAEALRICSANPALILRSLKILEMSKDSKQLIQQFKGAQVFEM